MRFTLIHGVFSEDARLVSLPSYKRNSLAVAVVTKNQTELLLGKRVINASLPVSYGAAERRRRSLTDSRINRLAWT